MGLGNININDLMKQVSNLKNVSDNNYNVSGMTKIFLPMIVRDFPEFNENRIYNMTEEGLRIIFNAITNKDTKKLNKIPLLETSIRNMIDDYEKNHIDISYSDILFHDFAIKDYTKENGVVTLTISTSLEYYYKKINNGKIEIDNRYKKQTRYACKFIYIYDESLFKDYEKVISINCPNCGAVIKKLGSKSCDYCGSDLKEINLKTWAFSSYEEY